MARLRCFLAPLLVLAVAAPLSGCGDPGGTSATRLTASSAAAGPAARYMPADAMLYVQADRGADAWPRLDRLRERIPFGDERVPFEKHLDPLVGLRALATLITAGPLSPDEWTRIYLSPLFTPPPGTGDDIALAITGPPTVAADDSYDVHWSFLSYRSVSDRSELADYEKEHSKRIIQVGDFTVYTTYPGEWVKAVSRDALLVADSLPAMRAAIARRAAGTGSLSADPAFRAAMARNRDSGAAIVGYTRGDLVDSLEYGLLGLHSEPQYPTAVLGLDHTSFSAGLGEAGLWVKAHPAVRTPGFAPGPVFAPTLAAQAVPRGSYLYLGLADAGTQLGQLGELYQGVGKYLGGVAESSSLPAWAERTLGLAPADALPFMRGEQAWWWGPQSGVAFRPPDPSAAFSAAERVSGHAGGLGYGIERLSAGRMNDVVTIKGERPAYAKRGQLGTDPAFKALLRAARVPGRVSLLFYADRTLVHGFDPPIALWKGDPNNPGVDDPLNPAPEPGSKEAEGTAQTDVLSSLVLWVAPTRGGYDVTVYATLENPG